MRPFIPEGSRQEKGRQFLPHSEVVRTTPNKGIETPVTLLPAAAGSWDRSPGHCWLCLKDDGDLRVTEL